MKRNLRKQIWLSGASLLAIILGLGDANAVVFGSPEGFQYIIPSTDPMGRWIATSALAE